MDRVRQQTERRALEQAGEKYTDWQVFTLWLRAVVDAAGGIPAIVAERWNPELLSSLTVSVRS